MLAEQSTPASPDLTTRLLSRWPQIAERMLAEGLAAKAPAELPAGHFTAEVLPTIYACGRAVLDAIASNREFTKPEVAMFVAPVAERHAEDRLPLPLLIDAIHASAQSLLAAASTEMRPDEMSDFIHVFSRLLDLLRHINMTVVETYTEVEQSIYHAEREARRELCSALVRGLPAEELAARADTMLAEQYTVLAIHLDEPPRTGSAANLLTRRRIRVLQRALDALTGTTTPATFDGTSGIALLSRSEADVLDAERFDQLATRLAEQFGVPVFLAEFSEVARDDIPAAAKDATELTELARLRGKPGGCYRLDDLLLEYQLTRPGPARERLAQRVIPLLSSPHLVDALEAHLQFGADRKTASRRIHVHPNTFTYRLRRIADLTGLDPADPKDSRMLAAALTVYRLDSA
ncbi:PucR family transcriptional regulator [Nocardia caishijiensis]|uniref:PucR-like helix-turn-helix protein n=1 Tax=Nocardia caishijiensis TaxID=184756 RepID=A0ABQ6YL60_9NOCA|nr:helix-turn-helix domain-containing protein [Nocardia caishijiensis]KAF0846520.1 PucR-like helix-turn-helix protein [Nocardia caishijiensis]